MKNKYLPTYEDCLELCNYKDSPFYEAKIVVNGFDVSVFNYRLAQWSDFDKPLVKNPLLKGYELRGLTFVFNKDGSLFKRYLLLNKFFNLNQTEDTLYDVVKDYKIKTVANKEDGSLGTFIKLPDGSVVGKTKMGFNNDQANAINKIFNNDEKLRNFVNEMLDNDVIPAFEFVSPFNRIVLRYSTDELILTQLRDNKTGEYLDLRDFNFEDINVVEYENYDNLDDLVDVSHQLEDKEGWVIVFENGEMLKVKTKWYFERHMLLTEDIHHENVIIEFILDDVIDDVLANIPLEEFELRNRINSIVKFVRHEVSELENKINEEYDRFLGLNITRKEYAIYYGKINPYFSFVVQLLDKDEMLKMTDEEIINNFKSYELYNESLERRTAYNMAVNYIKDKTKRLEMARDWLREKRFEV